MQSNVISLDDVRTNAHSTASLGGYLAQGMQGTKAVIFSPLSKTVFKLSPSDLKEMNLLTICGAKWCDHYYTELNPKKEELVFNYRRLATDIVRDCQAKGPFVESHERRSGVWQRADGGLVVNGSELWTPEGETLLYGSHPHGSDEERLYTAGGSIGFGLDTPLATPEEVTSVTSTFGSLEWRNPLGAELLLGWFGVAVAASALKRRPHVLLTGRAGIGKSTALETMAWLLGPTAFRATGPQTLAAYAQALTGTSRAVILDEFEADAGKRSCKDTFDMSRMSYSLQEGDAGMVRGSASGAPVSYRTCAPFLAAGISPGRMEPADVTRWVILEAVSRKEGGKRLTEAEAREIGPRLARLFVSRWSVYQASEEIVRERIILGGGDGRMADTVGTLLASYWAFVSDKQATAADVDALLERLNLGDRIAVHEDRDETRCLDALLTKVQPFQYMEGSYMVRRNLSIGQAIGQICGDPTGTLEVASRLSQMGIRVVRVQGTWRVYVANSPEHSELRRLFAGTKWAHGGWSTVLRRLPGGQESTQRLGPGTRASKVTVFEVPAEFLPVEEEEHMAA